MTISRSDYAVLVARQQKKELPVKEGWQDGALTVFVPGPPTHFKGKGHRYAVSKHTKTWRERTATHLLPHRSLYSVPPLPTAKGVIPVARIIGPWPWVKEVPKKIVFTIYGRSRFDDDNAKLVCSPCRDALKDMRVIDDDRESSGHTFIYAQAKPTRSPGAIHGIAIEIQLREDGAS